METPVTIPCSLEAHFLYMQEPAHSQRRHVSITIQEQMSAALPDTWSIGSGGIYFTFDRARVTTLKMQRILPQNKVRVGTYRIARHISRRHHFRVLTADSD